MEYFGYAGKILIINLSNNEIKERNLTREEIKNYIGGFGLNKKLIAEFYKPMTAPFSEKNPIMQ